MKKTKKAIKPVAKISSTNRLEEMLLETEAELEQLEPQIEKLEKQIARLKELKLTKQKLITLRLSIKSILSNFSEGKVTLSADLSSGQDFSDLLSGIKPSHFSTATQDFKNTAILSGAPQPMRLPGTFLPDRAFSQVNEVLRKKTSLNYELFRAIVFNGGQANTEQIKSYLLENNIKQPASGIGFEDVELTDISSRVNYLVRKGLVNPDGRGNFVSCLGWMVQAE